MTDQEQRTCEDCGGLLTMRPWEEGDCNCPAPTPDPASAEGYRCPDCHRRRPGPGEGRVQAKCPGCYSEKPPVAASAEGEERRRWSLYRYGAGDWVVAPYGRQEFPPGAEVITVREEPTDV